MIFNADLLSRTTSLYHSIMLHQTVKRLFIVTCLGGNWGGSPIYKVGEPGSECPDGSTNVDGLCQLDKLE